MTKDHHQPPRPPEGPDKEPQGPGEKISHELLLVKRRVRKRFLKILSWITGISLGSAVLLVVLALGAASLIVRTETFQNAVRDRVVRIAKDELNATITFETTEVSLFSLSPSLSFNNVRLEHPDTKLDLSLQQLKISLSLFVSIPLLFVRQLHLDEVEITGLAYQLNSLRTIERAIERFRPKSDYLPSLFQTTLKSVSLKDISLDLSLKPQGLLKEPVTGGLLLESAQIDFLASAIDFSGAIQLDDLRYGALRPFTGRLEIEDSSHNLKRTVFSALRFTTGDSSFEVSGEVKDWNNPQLRLQGDAQFWIHEIDDRSPLNGLVVTKLQLDGPVDQLKGGGKATLRKTTLRNRPWRDFDARWSIAEQRAIIDAQEVEVAGLRERVTLTASLPLKSADAFSLRLSLADANVSDYFGLLAPDFQVWGGTMTGHLDYQANRDNPLAGTANLQLDFTDLDIKGYPSEASIFLAEVARLTAQVTIKQAATKRAEKKQAVETAFDFVMKIGAASVTGRGSTGAAGLTIESVLESEGRLGKLLRRDVEIKGRSMVHFGGPWSRLQLTGEPVFSEFSLDEHRLTNLKGTVIYVDRKLTGVPIDTDQLSVYGGIQFYPGKPNEFAPLRFNIRDLSPSFIFSLVGLKSELTNSLKGRMEGRGTLRGPINRPIGSGLIQIRDWLFYKMKTKGFLAKGKWATAGSDFYFDQIALRFHRDDQFVNGEMSFDRDGLVALSFDSGQLRFASIQEIFAWSLPVQSNTSFSFNYHRDSPSLELKFQMTKTQVSGLDQSDSSGHMVWEGADGAVEASLFGGALQLKGLGEESHKSRRWNWALSLRDFAFASFSKPLAQARLDWTVSGDGNLAMTQSTADTELIGNLFSLDAAYEGEIQVQSSALSRVGAVLHRLEPFKVVAKTTAENKVRWILPSLQTQSDRGVFEASGHFEDPSSFEFSMDGPLDLRAWSAFYPSLSRSEGWLAVRGQLRPQGFYGNLNVQDAFVTVNNSPLFLRNGQAVVISEGPRMELKSMKGDFREGTLEGKGQAFLSQGNLEEASLQLYLRDSLFQPQQGVSFKATGPLELEVRNQKGRVSGELKIREGVYRRRFDMKADLLKFTQRSRIQAAWDTEDKNTWDDWTLNIGLVSEEALVFRNNLVDGVSNINLRVLGSVEDPRLRGSIDVVRGQFYYVNRQFTVRSGSIQFSDPTSNIPVFDVRADTEISDYRVFLQIRGSGENQKITYSSEPPLNEKEILQLVLSGIPPRDSQEFSSSLGGSSTASPEDPTRNLSFSGITFVTGQFQDRIERRLYSDLGIRRFGLSPAFSESTRSTELQLTVGTDLIRNRLEVNYSNMLSARGGHKVELELRVNRIISLIGSWRSVEGGAEQDFGGDLRFRFEVE